MEHLFFQTTYRFSCNTTLSLSPSMTHSFFLLIHPSLHLIFTTFISSFQSTSAPAHRRHVIDKIPATLNTPFFLTTFFLSICPLTLPPPPLHMRWMAAAVTHRFHPLAVKGRLFNKCFMAVTSSSSTLWLYFFSLLRLFHSEMLLLCRIGSNIFSV